MMDEKHMAIRFWDNANLYVGSRGYGFGGGSSTDIKKYSRTAAHEVVIHPGYKAGLGGVLIRRADQAFETLIDGMIVAANEMPGYLKHHPGTLGEDTLYKAQVALCPIWPFC